VVWRETEGHPFFVAEVLRHLSESRAIEQQDGRWVLRADLGELRIPEGVRDVVGRRLSLLAESTNRLLAVGAVIGLEFDAAVVERAGGAGEEELLAALEEATHARLLVEVPGARYRFAHALVRATLYDELTGARRVALHRRVAEAIESLHRRPHRRPTPPGPSTTPPGPGIAPWPNSPLTRPSPTTARRSNCSTSPSPTAGYGFDS